MRKTFIVALLVGLLELALLEPTSAACVGPCTKAQITTDIGINWPDNTTQQITPSLLRSTVSELLNSYVDANGTTTLACSANQWIAGLPTLSTATCLQPAFTNISGVISPAQSIIQSVFTRTGAVIAVAGDYNSSQINTTSSLTGGVLRTQLTKNGDVINAADFGVVCDGSTVNTTAWATAVAALPSTGGILDVPRGICIGTVVLNKPIIFRGQGWSNSGSTGTCGSEIRSTAAADNVILISSQGVQVRDLCVTSSVAAGSRTGAGIKVTSGPNVLISRVFSNAHKYGIWNQGAGNEFEHVFTVGNQTYGQFHDGSSGAHTIDENGIYFCQANSNLGTAGIGIVAGGFAQTGFFLERPTSVGNTGAGLLISGAINDVHVNLPELSSNTAQQLDAINGTGGNLTVTGGLIEQVSGGGNTINTGTAQQFVTLTGNIITSPSGVTMVIQGIQSTVTGNIITGAGTTSIITYGGSANNMTISGNTIIGNSGAGEVGITITAGLTGCMIGANVFTTTTTQISDGTAACTYAAITTTKPTYP